MLLHYYYYTLMAQALTKIMLLYYNINIQGYINYSQVW